MRKTIAAITLGLTALAAAACGNSGTTNESVDPGLETMPAVESVDPGAESMDPALESVDPALESPSDMLESPSAS